jgi:deoxycytidylate deaminase
LEEEESKMNIHKFFEMAKRNAKKSSLYYWRMGSVIVKGGKVISNGYNRYSGDIGYIEKKYNVSLFSLHAEMDAIRSCDINEDFRGTAIFISGINRNGKKIMCRPCEACMKMIRFMGIKTVYYESPNGYEIIKFD